MTAPLLLAETNNTDTTCPYCGVGCGVSITSQDNQLQPVAGNTRHPANFGKLCVKGSALHETLDDTDRLLTPRIRGSQAEWSEALDLVAGKMRKVIDEHGSDAVAIYAAGQILTEDYYVANKLMKGFIGSANLDTNSRLCMASAVVAHKRAFGSDTVPGCYEDLEEADLLVMIGSNAAWAHPILYQRMAAAKKADPNKRVVIIDPRKTASSDLADLHLSIKPGSDALLFNGLLAWLESEQAFDQNFINQFTEGFETALEKARSGFTNVENLAAELDVPVSQLQQFFDWFRDTNKTVSFFSQGINQSSSGVDKGNAIINLHLATGRIGKPGACPFSITGQPNAMGGREVGGLANQLAAHMDFAPADIDRVQRFWNAPYMATAPGLKAIDMFDAIKNGKIKFVWIISTNPLVSMPDADDVKLALQNCELVVVQDCMANTDTAVLADVLLPAASWGEKNGTVTNSERRISRQRSFLLPAGDSRPDWWIMAQVAQRLGFAESFNYQHPSEIFDEYTRLTGFENNNTRDLDLSGLSGMSQQQYDALAPIQWPVNDRFPEGRTRFYDDGHFYTPTGKARFVAVTPELPKPRSDEGSLVMNTGRVRDHWHTMTRTAKSARLAQHIREPYVDIHPEDAASAGLEDGALATISNKRGDILVRTQLSEQQRKGEIFVPMHWTDRYASKGRMGALIDKTADPLSGQPELKYSRVNVMPFRSRWQGMLLSYKDLGAVPCEYWAYGPDSHCHSYEIAGTQDPQSLLQWAQASLAEADYHWQIFEDNSNHHLRVTAIKDGKLQLLLFVHPQALDTPRQWLKDCFNMEQLDATTRKSLLAGRPAEGVVDEGRMVCSCFSVGEKTILAAIEGGCGSADDLGKELKCGTNCGSCIPELKALVSKAKTAV